MSDPTIPKLGQIVAGDVIVGGVSFARRLASGETISGLPTATVAEQLNGSGGLAKLTLSSPAANDEVASIDGNDVAVSEGVLFTITASSTAVIGDVYQIVVTVVTTDGQTLNERVNVAII